MLHLLIVATWMVKPNTVVILKGLLTDGFGIAKQSFSSSRRKAIFTDNKSASFAPNLKGPRDQLFQRI